MTNHVNTYAVVDRQAQNLEYYNNRRLHRSFEYKSYVWGWALRFAFGVGVAGFAIFYIWSGYSAMKNAQQVDEWKHFLYSFFAGSAAFGLALAYGLDNRVRSFDDKMDKIFEEMEFGKEQPANNVPELATTNNATGVMAKTRRNKKEEFAGHEFIFTGRNLDKLLAWYEGGAISIRKENSAAGPGFNKLPDPISSHNYTTALYVLQGRGLVEEKTNQWTEDGLRWLQEE